MAKFDWKNSKARKFYQSQKGFSGFVFGFATFFCGALFLMSIFLMFSDEVRIRGLGEVVLSLVLFFQSYLLARKFATVKLEKTGNMVDCFSASLIELIELTIFEARKENVKEITPEYLFRKISLVPEGKLFCLRIGVPFVKKTRGRVLPEEPTISADLIDLFNLIDSEQVAVEDFLLAVINLKPIEKYLTYLELEKKEVQKLILCLADIKKRSLKRYFWQDETMLAGVGQDWSYGYTPILSAFSYDLSRFFQDPNLKINIFGHQNKIDDIQTILAKPSKNNVLLVGEPGVGKKTIVNALAMKLARGECLSSLAYKRIRQLDVGRILANAGPGQLEARLQGALSDATSAGNIILYIDNFQSLLGGYGQDKEIGGIDASQILIPYLENSRLQIIASLAPNDYFDRVRRNAAISGVFEKIKVESASPDDTLSIMLESLGYLESHYNVFYLLTTLKKAIKLAERYIHDVPFPEKGLRLLEEAAVNFSEVKLRVILPADMEDLVSKKTNVPVGEAQETEREKLLNLESFLHQRVVGQNEAISAVADTLRRARAGISSGKRPLGVFLFLGPTGVGKTETARALAENYFGSEKNMIRLDMSEYQNPNSLDRLVGTVDSPNGILTNAVLERPFSLILLDELEKADRNVLNLFLQIFEDGRLTDARGRVSDFTNAIIIATSNAGSELIREAVASSQTQGLRERLINFLQKQGIFSPEFLNRFDGVIVFEPLTHGQLIQVAGLMIKGVNERLKEKNIQVEVDEGALNKLVELGYEPEFGARPMRRVITEKIENLLAKKMLSGEVGEGQVLKVTLSDIV